MRSVFTAAILLMSGILSPAAALPTMEQAQAPPAPKLNGQACIANPDRDCVAEIVLALARQDTNDSNQETIAGRLAIGGRIDLAERLAEYVRNPANRRHLQRVLAQRRIVEDAMFSRKIPFPEIPSPSHAIFRQDCR
jgi:hypothetical protein